MRKLVLISEEVLLTLSKDKYEIIDEDYEIREIVTYNLNIGDLPDYQIVEIIDCYKQARLENAIGLNVDINLGRDRDTDMRTYNLSNVSVIYELESEYDSCDIVIKY